MGHKKGTVYTKILYDKNENNNEVKFIGTAKVPNLYKYLKIEKLLPHPWVQSK